MNDPWKYIAFPVASAAGYIVSLGITGQVQSMIGLSEFATRIIVISVTGLVAGFMVDEVIPTYLQHTRGGGAGDMDLGGGDDDFDLG
ncbi:MAG: hypothetical protein ACI9LV_000070 [Candidatus Nanohaloarchaea archaeon]|jgi:hypothetical protein